MRAGNARPGEDRDLLRGVEGIGRANELRLGRDHARGVRADLLRRRLDVGERDVAGDHEHRDSALLDRLAHRDPQHARHLVGRGDVLGVHAALAEQLLRVRLLEVAGSDLVGRDVRRDREHGNARTLRVEQAVDQMQVTGPAAAGADRQLAREGRLGARREGRGLLVPNVHPLDVVRDAQCVGESVQRIAGEAVHAPHPARVQRIDDVLGERGHWASFLRRGRALIASLRRRHGSHAGRNVS